MFMVTFGFILQHNYKKAFTKLQINLSTEEAIALTSHFFVFAILGPAQRICSALGLWFVDIAFRLQASVG